ncbi:MAG: hypothetical protein HOK83_04200 [Rhodospirillaceae bacterium]|jgi:hypothetical protein|nr:hypothetical protein [Rhodospirillaceae bacterium]
MKFLSVRKRPPELGSFPMEFIDRSDGVGEYSAPPKSTAEVRDDALLARCAEPFLELASSLRDGDVATELAPLDHSPEALARQMKAAAYFLDTSMVGICATDDGSAIVLLIEHPRLPEKDNPARAWIEGAEHSHVALRGSEVANTLAGYLRWLGYPAKAHFADASDVDLAELAVDSGLAEVRRGQLTNPFVGAAFGLAAVTTGAPLMADRPLDAKRHRIFDRVLGYWFGRGGAVSGLEKLKHSLRPTHLSRYPMERIRRVKEPTTLIREDEVPRVPSRAGFFSRAAHGDLGDKAKREVPRFAGKHPFAEAMEVLMEAQLPLQDGATAPRNAPGLTEPEANARAVKSLCYALGADLFGICEAKPYAWYSHDPEGKEIEPDHCYAIVMLFDQGYATMEGSSGDDWISGAQSYRAYMRGGQIGSVAAAMLRDLGHDARCHSAYKGQVLQIPLVLLAGLGELSRIGELVLNPFVGPRFKSAVITTDLPLQP